MSEYELNVHWKQGDDLNGYLEKTDDASSALKEWAEDSIRKFEAVLELSKILEGKKVDIEVGAHHIGLHGDEEVLDEAVEKDLINKLELDDDFEDEDFDEEFYEEDK